MSKKNTTNQDTKDTYSTRIKDTIVTAVISVLVGACIPMAVSLLGDHYRVVALAEQFSVFKLTFDKFDKKLDKINDKFDNYILNNHTAQK